MSFNRSAATVGAGYGIQSHPRPTATPEGEGLELKRGTTTVPVAATVLIGLAGAVGGALASGVVVVHDSTIASRSADRRAHMVAEDTRPLVRLAPREQGDAGEDGERDRGRGGADRNEDERSDERASAEREDRRHVALGVAAEAGEVAEVA